MDIKKIGLFLAELRREAGFTQEQLGEKLGVTNKTISRWENGNYMPPVDILQMMSELYGISMNELVSGERLMEKDYRENAEKNIKSVLKTSSFTVKEEIAFYKRKWSKDHLSSTVVFCVILVILVIYGYNNIGREVNVIAPVLVTAFCIIRYNVMMAYVERNVFDTPEKITESRAKNKSDHHRTQDRTRTVRRLQLAALFLLGICGILTASLGCNLIYSLIPELNDGITIRTPLAYLVYSDHWSLARFFEGFEISLNITCLIGLCNIVLAGVRHKIER